MDAAIQATANMALARAGAPVPLHMAPSASMAAIEKTAKDFEAMFLTQMLQPMFETVDIDPDFGGGHGEEVMRTFMVQEYGKILAQHSSTGIADAVKTELIRAQQQQQQAGNRKQPYGAQHETAR